MKYGIRICCRPSRVRTMMLYFRIRSTMQRVPFISLSFLDRFRKHITIAPSFNTRACGGICPGFPAIEFKKSSRWYMLSSSAPSTPSAIMSLEYTVFRSVLNLANSISLTSSTA